jgi:UDP:flavonoid glycosyltransferase YjiC (YdhE family)
LDFSDLAVKVIATFATVYSPAGRHPKAAHPQIPDSLRDAHVEQVVPHSAVLKRGVLLVSHAGHGSVMKALWEGKPMVLVPWGRDQPGVAARAHALGVAEVVARGPGSEVTLAAAIDRVLASSEMREAAASHATRLQATDPPGTAATHLESLAS